MKKVFIVLLTITLAITCFCFTACKEDETNSGNSASKEYGIYQTYVVYAKQIGEKPLSYAEWLKSVKGEKGDQGEQGPQGEKGDKGDDGVSIIDVSLNDGQIYVYFSDGTIKQIGGIDYTEREEQFAFMLNGDLRSYSLVGRGSVTDSNIIVPTTYNDLPVTAIGDYCFSGDYIINFIQIPESVKKIGKNAFSGSGLRHITVQASDVEIEASSLSDIYNLLTITMESDLVADVLRYEEYIDCPKLVQLTSRDTNVIYQYILNNMTDEVKNLGFEMRTSVDASFDNTLVTTNNGITTYTIGDKVYLIDVKTRTVDWKMDLSDRTNITNVYPNAFYMDTRPLNLKLPRSTKEIGDYAFYNSGVRSVSIPKSVTTIGDWVFYGCGNLNSIVYEGTEEEWNAITKGSNWCSGAGRVAVYFNNGQIVNSTSSVITGKYDFYAYEINGDEYKIGDTYQGLTITLDMVREVCFEICENDEEVNDSYGETLFGYVWQYDGETLTIKQYGQTILTGIKEGGKLIIDQGNGIKLILVKGLYSIVN